MYFVYIWLNKKKGKGRNITITPAYDAARVYGYRRYPYVNRSVYVSLRAMMYARGESVLRTARGALSARELRGFGARARACISVRTRYRVHTYMHIPSRPNAYFTRPCIIAPDARVASRIRDYTGLHVSRFHPARGLLSSRCAGQLIFRTNN